MSSRKLYLDKDRAKIAGVCAGLADFFGIDANIVRLIWVVLTFWSAGVLIPIYILAAWLLDPKPGSGYSRSRLRDHDVYGASEPVNPSYRLADAKTRFERLEQRLRKLETVVTSREFQMDRELRRQ